MEKFNRLILIDKPVGLSSFGVVARWRRQLNQEYRDWLAGQPSGQYPTKIKVGHTGTLDPFASGLMILLSGQMTRQANQFSNLDKVYQATIRLAATSTTGDPEGEICQRKINTPPALDDILKALGQFRGEIKQRPPIFSAIKINGRRAYQLARRGQTPVMPSRTVTIYSLDLLDYHWPRLEIQTRVSKGTYIRSLAADIGDWLKVSAYTEQLRRLKVGPYDVKDAQSLADLA
jgi:tRNA pseudouridine55 synthase